MADPVVGAGGAARVLGRTLGAIVDGPGDIKRHNRRAVREYQDMLRWMADEEEKLQEALRVSLNELAARGMLDSGERSYREHTIRKEFARRYRDRRSRHDRALEDLHDSEGLIHRVWRKILRQDWPPNPYAVEGAELVARWEAQLRDYG